MRLLVPPGSLLLARPELARAFGPFDPDLLGHPWQNPDPRVDALQQELAALAERDARTGRDPQVTLDEMHRLVHRAAGSRPPVPVAAGSPRRSAPRMSEPWFC
jgi:hypothetical protein